MDQQTITQIRQAVQEAFSAGVDDKRYIDVTRIPLICQSINQIGKDISDIKLSMTETKESNKESYITVDQFMPVKSIVYGMAGAILIAVIGELIAQVVK